MYYKARMNNVVQCNRFVLNAIGKVVSLLNGYLNIVALFLPVRQFYKI